MSQKRGRCKCSLPHRPDGEDVRRLAWVTGIVLTLVPMSLVADVFWSFRSPYSYLATPRLVALEREWDLELRVRVVLPLAVRKPDFFATVNPLWPPYLLRDTARIAEFLGLPYGWPQPDPIVQDYATRRVAPEQPYIHRLTRLGVEAALRGRGLPFVDEVSRVIWGGTVQGWDRGTHLADAAARAGLDLASMDAAVAADPARYDERIAENQRALDAAGHWGVPTMVFEGEPFFGQDRLELLFWRLRQRGLERRR
jgi:2-hydroxychromene-2-carboxylate isomerase